MTLHKTIVSNIHIRDNCFCFLGIELTTTKIKHMKRKLMIRFSIIGFILISASALISAILPFKKASLQTNSFPFGTLRIFSGDLAGFFDIYSCQLSPIVNYNCHFTAETETTGIGLGTIIQTNFGHKYQTYQNTSMSDGNEEVDTTSLLLRA